MLILVTIAAAVASIVAGLALFELRTAVRALQMTATTVREAIKDGAGTDPKLLERIESAERRVGEMSDDINRRYRKLAQERRRLGVHLEDDDEESPEATPAALAALRAQVGTREEPAPNGRTRLRRRR